MIEIKHYGHDEDLDSESKRFTVVEAVAKIEAQVQPLDAWDYQDICKLLDQKINHLAIALWDDQVVGYCLYQCLFDQAEIFRIATHPAYRRQGVADRLLTWLRQWLQSRAVTSLLLEVRADNLAAIQLYQRHGFKTIHRRLGYYHYKHSQRPPIDALIMQCST